MRALRSILVTTDNFWIGGRETFLDTYVGELKQREGSIVRLLATDARSARAASLFDEVTEAGPRDGSEMARWAERGRVLLARRSADLVWAQHYRLLPAWCLARAADTPLLATFHGPLDTAGRFDSPLDALGAALALASGCLSAAISEEVAESLVAAGACPEQVRLLPNRVRIPFVPRPFRPQSRRRVLLLMREDKLGHLRESVRLFRALRRRLGDAEFVVHRGVVLASAQGGREGIESQANMAARVLGRRWLLRHPELIFHLRRIRFVPPTAEPARAIGDADVVVGMGRVVLESLAAGRPTVLVGYDRIVGLVDARLFAAARRTNFSGRGLPAAGAGCVAERVAAALAEPAVDPEIRAEIDVARHWPETRSLLAESLGANVRSADGELMERVERVLRDRVASESERVGALLATLRERERTIFERLCALSGL